jgi:hypothetical protein
MDEFPVNLALLSFTQGHQVYLATMHSGKTRRESIEFTAQGSSEKKMRTSEVKKQPRRQRHVDSNESIDGHS